MKNIIIGKHEEAGAAIRTYKDPHIVTRADQLLGLHEDIHVILLPGYKQLPEWNTINDRLLSISISSKVTFDIL